MVPIIQKAEILRKSRLFAGPHRQRPLNYFSIQSALEEGPRAAAAFSLSHRQFAARAKPDTH